MNAQFIWARVATALDYFLVGIVAIATLWVVFKDARERSYGQVAIDVVVGAIAAVAIVLVAR